MHSINKKLIAFPLSLTIMNKHNFHVFRHINLLQLYATPPDDDIVFVASPKYSNVCRTRLTLCWEKRIIP